MKFTLTFKTNDVLDQALEDPMTCAEEDAIKKCAEKFIEYGEYVHIEMDTETGTATVMPL